MGWYDLYVQGVLSLHMKTADCRQKTKGLSAMKSTEKTCNERSSDKGRKSVNKNAEIQDLITGGLQ